MENNGQPAWSAEMQAALKVLEGMTVADIKKRGKAHSQKSLGIVKKRISDNDARK